MATTMMASSSEGSANRRARTIRRTGPPLVADIMTRSVVTATPASPLPELVDLMLRYGISGVPIVDEDARLIGIVTEADLLSKPAFGGEHRRKLAALALLAGHGRRWMSKASGLTAAEIMTTPVETAYRSESVRAVARRMVERGVHRLPVVDSERLIGIISRSDVLCRMHRDDEELQREIAAALSDPLRIPETTEVTVAVADGVVTLRGAVRYPIDLPVITAIVWRFPGVVDVHNEVIARQANPEPTGRGFDFDSMSYLR